MAHHRDDARPRTIARLLWLTLAWVALVPRAHATDDSSLARVAVDGVGAGDLAAVLRRDGFDVLDGTIDGTRFEVVVTPAELDRLQEYDVQLTVVELGRPFREIQAERRGIGGSVPAGYADLAAILVAMSDLADAHPDRCELVDLTQRYGTPATSEGRHLHALVISDNVTLEEDEPTMLVVSNHHARELVTPVLALAAATRLLDDYGIDPRVTAAVDANEIWIAPVWNPDGYHHVFEAENLWRKNRRVFADGVGVDTNRNYPAGWETACSGSNSPGSNTYKGPAPASEPETQTMLAWSADRRFAKVIDYHSSGEETLYGYSCLDHPFSAFMATEAAILSTECDYEGQIRPPSADGEHYQTQFARFGAHAFLIETETQFQPPYEDAVAEAERVWPGILWMLERPVPLHGHVTDATTGMPLAASIRLIEAAWTRRAPRPFDFTNGETNSSGGPFGRYHAFVPPGTYVFEFSAPGHLPARRTVRVAGSASSVEIDVSLVPETIAISFPAGRPERLGPEGAELLVDIDEIVAGSLQPGSETLHYRTAGGGLTELALDLIVPGSYRASLPDLACPTMFEYYVSARDSSGEQITSPVGAPFFGTYSAAIANQRTIAFAEDFESGAGWQVRNLGASEGIWERGVPIDDPGYPHDPLGDADGSGQCFVTDNQPGGRDVDDGAVQLISPAFDLTGGVATIDYDYFLRLSRDDGDDRLVVEIQNFGSPGAAWHPIAVHSTDGNLYWRRHTVRQADLDALGVRSGPTMRLRFTVNDSGSSSVVEAGIDAIRITLDRCDG